MKSENKITKITFKQQLLQTHMFILIQFAVSLLIVFTTLFWISWQTKFHLKQVGPLVETVNQLSRGVNESMLLLDERLLTAPAADIQEDRQTLWDTVIYPAAENLYEQVKEYENDKSKLLFKLQELQAEQ